MPNSGIRPVEGQSDGPCSAEECISSELDCQCTVSISRTASMDCNININDCIRFRLVVNISYRCSRVSPFGVSADWWALACCQFTVSTHPKTLGGPGGRAIAVVTAARDLRPGLLAWHGLTVLLVNA